MIQKTFQRAVIEAGLTKPATFHTLYVRVEVPAYVKQKFPNVVRTPVLIDHTTPPVYLRP